VEFGAARGDPSTPLYARKHVPWVSFSNLPRGATSATSCNLRFRDFPSGPEQFDSLPTVSFVIPNLENDMHNGALATSVCSGDIWLRKRLDPYYQWAKTHNSLLILTFDECDDRSKMHGLTDPSAQPLDQERKDLQNRICTIFAGASIKPDDYPEGCGITHVNILRTLESMYGLPRSGAQQPLALKAGIADDFLITDVFIKRVRP
jgi:acid phosphatase